MASKAQTWASARTQANPGPGTASLEALRHCCCTVNKHALTPGWKESDGTERKPEFCLMLA